MADILSDISRTFSEYLILPGLTRAGSLANGISLAAPIQKFALEKGPGMRLNIPVTSACMQAVSGAELAISLARHGGLSFVFCSQPIEEQAAMIGRVKSHKAGFVRSDSNLKPKDSLRKFLAVRKHTGHSTMPVTHDGGPHGKFLGIVTEKDFWEYEDDLDAPVSQYMTPVEKVISGRTGVTLREANAVLHKHKKECLPVLEADGRLNSLVFTKDYVDHQHNPNEVLDTSKRLLVGAALNTHDYTERVPALVEAGADVLCFDSSDGYSEFQREAALWVRKQYGQDVVLGGGNVVSAEAFSYLVEEARLDFVKVGIGGGSICITREQKGIGRGQASAVMDVVRARDAYAESSGTYVPICSDGGLANDTQIIIALAMGADFVMMGRYFAMTFESPTPRVSIKDKLYKPYWGEGSNRAKNWKRYTDSAGPEGLLFEEGVDAYVPIVGSLRDVLPVTLSKLTSTMASVGAADLREFSRRAVLVLVSEQSFVEGGTPNVVTFDQPDPTAGL